MDYDKIMDELADLGAERIEDNPDYVQLPTGFRMAVIISPEGERAYLVVKETWDAYGAGGGPDVIDTDDADEAITAARRAFAEMVGEGQ